MVLIPSQFGFNPRSRKHTEILLYMCVRIGKVGCPMLNGRIRPDLRGSKTELQNRRLSRLQGNLQLSAIGKGEIAEIIENPLLRQFEGSFACIPYTNAMTCRMADQHR